MHLLPIEPIANFARNYLSQHLSPRLTYHRLSHTEDVVLQTHRLCLLYGFNQSTLEYTQLITAAWWHDAGYTAGYKNHEALSCMLVNQFLPGFNVGQQDIETICNMIMATRIPQQPQSFAEQIICDADLDYLGREDFDQQAQQLCTEWLNYGIIQNTATFNDIQIPFLESHHYFTPDSLTHKAPAKQAKIEALKLAAHNKMQ